MEKLTDLQACFSFQFPSTTAPLQIPSPSPLASHSSPYLETLASFASTEFSSMTVDTTTPTQVHNNNNKDLIFVAMSL